MPPLLKHSELETRLRAFRDDTPGLFALEEIGRSVEGRSLNHVWFGTGPFPVLLWSQMHGDEPTATAALVDVFEFFRRHRDEAAVRRLLASLTIHVVPMLNPDGAERFERRNAQGIDINRDALLLQTPEGRALKSLRDRLEPRLGFNLHNQRWRTSAGKTGRPATISLLAVAFDEARSDNEGRTIAKKTCSVIRDALEPLAPGQIARYDDEFEPRAFGDNLTRWGTQRRADRDRSVRGGSSGPGPRAAELRGAADRARRARDRSRARRGPRAVRVAADQRVQRLLPSDQERDHLHGNGRRAVLWETSASSRTVRSSRWTGGARSARRCASMTSATSACSGRSKPSTPRDSQWRLWRIRR